MYADHKRNSGTKRTITSVKLSRHICEIVFTNLIYFFKFQMYNFVSCRLRGTFILS
jgi:hypothetical protein